MLKSMEEKEKMPKAVTRGHSQVLSGRKGTKKKMKEGIIFPSYNFEMGQISELKMVKRIYSTAGNSGISNLSWCI